jgi:hypothetical protein
VKLRHKATAAPTAPVATSAPAKKQFVIAPRLPQDGL